MNEKEIKRLKEKSKELKKYKKAYGLVCNDFATYYCARCKEINVRFPRDCNSCGTKPNIWKKYFLNEVNR